MSETLREVILAFDSTFAIVLFFPLWWRSLSGTRYTNDADAVGNVGRVRLVPVPRRSWPSIPYTSSLARYGGDAARAPGL